MLVRFRDIREDCATCGSLATTQLFTERDVSLGKFCWRCAIKKSDELERAG